jgi:predicted transglutaminase-like cysteine proteinase
MQGRSIMSVIAAVARICLLIALWCGVAFAERLDAGISSLFQAVPANDMVAARSPQRASLAPSLVNTGADVSILRSELDLGALPRTEPGPTHDSTTTALPQLASLSLPERNTHISPSREPFDLPAMNEAEGDTPAKWSELRARILADERILAACATPNSPCPDAARRFLSVIELGRQHNGRARLGWINRAVNLGVRATNDWAQYGAIDFWASPLQTFASGAGDCEDYAIAKYVALRHLGIASDDLRLLIVLDTIRQAQHAIVAVRHGDQWLALDNRTMALLDVGQSRSYHPLFVMDDRGVRAFATIALVR